jgi:hypothetical protein
MKAHMRKQTIVLALAIAFALVSAFAAPAVAGGNTFWDSSTSEWLNGQSNDIQAASTVGGVPCDPAQVKRGGLSFLP